MVLLDVISANLPILRELRERMGQLELAERVGVSRRTIARLENSEVADPGVDLMTRIGQELGVSLSLLPSERLMPVSLAVPQDIAERLASDQAPRVLDAMVAAARQLR
jgi:transcriptional regulator with XRE-family HTH domain